MTPPEDGLVRPKHVGILTTRNQHKEMIHVIRWYLKPMLISAVEFDYYLGRCIQAANHVE
jgi:hypothetical protein